jgi:uracil-DNA glycosylase
MCNEANDSHKATASYEKGSKLEIAFVFSCPGKEEEEQGKPAARNTGKNLKDLLLILRRDYGLTEFQRGWITIANSWPIVEYEEKTGRSEATLPEVMAASNLDRLAEDIVDVTRYVICCGDNALASVSGLREANRLTENLKVIQVKHLGNRGLNHIHEGVGGTDIISAKQRKRDGDTRSIKDIQSDNRLLRLKRVAKDIVEDMELR